MKKTTYHSPAVQSPGSCLQEMLQLSLSLDVVSKSLQPCEFQCLRSVLFGQWMGNMWSCDYINSDCFLILNFSCSRFVCQKRSQVFTVERKPKLNNSLPILRKKFILFNFICEEWKLKYPSKFSVSVCLSQLVLVI